MTEPRGLPAGDCALHKDHGSAKPLRMVVHHIQPLGMGGPDIKENKIVICNTGHLNVHWLLASLVYGFSVDGGSRTERKLAKQGYDAWVQAGKPGNPHAAYG